VLCFALRFKKIILRAHKNPKLASLWPPDTFFRQPKLSKKPQTALSYAQIALVHAEKRFSVFDWREYLVEMVWRISITLYAVCLPALTVAIEVATAIMGSIALHRFCAYG
jgi:hypothetical protein